MKTTHYCDDVSQEITEMTKNYYQTDLPIGYKNKMCPNCYIQALIAIVTKFSDLLDPNILCLNCHWEN